MSVTASQGYFLKDGKPFFLASGEIHYFRLDPRLWETHLIQLKRAGANTTSTYVPWDWHEYEEGRVDFSGDTHPARNLVRYMELCHKVGLDLIVKPGPYILAEYEHHGLPAWLVRREDKNALALDEHGKVLACDRMSYLSDTFLRYVFHWYDKIMPLIAKYQASKNGPITMMQVCNEVGVFQWLSGKIDYNESVVRHYRLFLGEEYASVQDLNKRYGTEYACLGTVFPPHGPIESRNEYCAYYDFHLFYRAYYATYFKTLIQRIRSYGVTVQLTHNIPGWIYGSASELPMLVSTYGDVLKRLPEIAFGLDHIPEYVSFRNAHADLACNKILQAVQPDGPVWAAEFQAGTREHHVKNDAKDMEMFYFASLAHGLKGLNYYMFSQGMNPSGKGVFGKMFYFQTPLDVSARKSALYGVAKKIGQFVNREKENLLLSRSKAKICVGFYSPYFYTDLTSSQLLRDRKFIPEKIGLKLDPKFVREEILFNGVMRAFQTLNISYDVHDLQSGRMDSLLRYKQLWMVTTEFMDRDTQEFLLSYVNHGGHLILTPAIPTMDNYLGECTILRDGLDLKFRTEVSSQKIEAFGIPEVFTLTPQKQTFPDSVGEVISLTASGEICGIRKKVGKGIVTALGYAFGYTTDEHLFVYKKIAALDGVKSEVRTSDPDIQVVVRHGRKYSYMFLLNYHNVRKTFTVDSQGYSLAPFSCKVVRKK